MIFSRNRKKGGDKANEKERERPRRGEQSSSTQPSTHHASTQDMENSFPLLKRMASSRGIIPILVMISLLFGMIIASMLLRQAPSGGWEAPVARYNAPHNQQPVSVGQRGGEATNIALQHDVPLTDVPRKADIGNPDAAETVGSSHNSHAPHTPSDTEGSLVAIALNETEVPQTQQAATMTSFPTSLEASGASEHAAIISPAPTTQTQDLPPTVKPVRGIQRFSYNNSHGEQRDIQAFPVAKGVFIFALAKPQNLTAASTSGNERDAENLKSHPRYAGLGDFARSRYACLCADAVTSPENFHVISRALERSVNGEQLPTVAGRPFVARSTAASSPTKHRLSEGRFPVVLADGQKLETRVMPCTGIFYASAAVALCDPSLNASLVEVEETDPPTPAPPPSPGSRRNQRAPPKPAMVPIGPCSVLDEETAHEVLSKRLFVPANANVRAAFIAAASDSTQPRDDHAPHVEHGTATNALDYFFTDADIDAAEMQSMCSQCGAPTESAERTSNARFRDSQRFRSVFFERERHPLLIAAIRGLVKSRWQVVRDLTEEDSSTSAQAEESSRSPPDAIGSSMPEVASGLRAIDSLNARCDKRRKAEHFAQCFIPHSQDRRKSGNWTQVAQYRLQAPNAKLRLRPSRFFSNITSAFPIPSRLMVHPLNIGGHIVCYASGDMVCDIVGRTGGWENELIQIVAYAASELRRLNRQAASILAVRSELVEQAALANMTETEYDAAFSAAVRRYQSSQGEFAVGALLERDNLTSLAYMDNDVTFIDIGGNVGVFAASMWKRGYRTEVFEALPHNVFLLESSRCTNQAEEFAIWEDVRSSRLSRAIRALEQSHAITIRRDMIARTNTTPSRAAVEEELATRQKQIYQEALKAIPAYYRADAESETPQQYGGGPWMPRFDVHHSALGNGKKGRSGDEAFGFTLNVSARVTAEDGEISEHLNAAARAAVAGESLESEETQSCVMISERHNFGDIVILCNQTLVAEARAALRTQGASRARVLKEYVPRGFVDLTSLDRLLSDPTEDIRLENTAMKRRFENLTLMAEAEEEIAASLVGTPPATAAAENTSVVNISSSVPSRRTRRAAPTTHHVVSQENTTRELLNFISHSQVVMKIDVEGQEEYVMQGAHHFLSDRAKRPKLILSEIWRKMNVARYGAFMIDVHGYVGFALTDRTWLRSTQDMLRFHRTMPREMDTIIWVLPEYKFLIPPSAFERRPVF